MNVVYTIPYRLHPVLRFVLRTCLALILIGSVIFTTLQFVKSLHQIHQQPKPMHGQAPVQKPTSNQLR